MDFSTTIKFETPKKYRTGQLLFFSLKLTLCVKTKLLSMWWNQLQSPSSSQTRYDLP